MRRFGVVGIRLGQLRRQLLQASPLFAARRRVRRRFAAHQRSGLRLPVQGPQRLGPPRHLGPIPIQLRQRIRITQQVHPAALEDSQPVVASIEVAGDHARKVFSQHLLGYQACPRLAVLEEALPLGEKAPQIAVAAVFGPPRLIATHRRSTAYPLPQALQFLLPRPFESVQQLHHFPVADVQSAHLLHQPRDHAHGHPAPDIERRHQTLHARPETPLPLHPNLARL